MWFKPYTIEEINSIRGGNMIGHLGIQFTKMTEQSLTATMPVDERTCQAAGILHGGASATLAETVGSVASYMSINPSVQISLGLELNINHIRSVTSGMVIATAVPVHIGRSTHVWNIRIEDEHDKLVAYSRLTIVIMDKPSSN